MLNGVLSDKKELSRLTIFFSVTLLLYLFVFQNKSLYVTSATYNNYSFFITIALFMTTGLYIISIFLSFQYVGNKIVNFSTKGKFLIYVIINVIASALYLFFNNRYIANYNIYFSQYSAYFSIPNHLYESRGVYLQNLSGLYLLLSLATFIILCITLVATIMFVIDYVLSTYYPNDSLTKKFHSYYSGINTKRYLLGFTPFDQSQGLQDINETPNNPILRDSYVDIRGAVKTWQGHDHVNQAEDLSVIFINDNESRPGALSCPKCGGQITSYDQYCPNCGTDINEKHSLL